jgi:hypothetical protein
MLDACGGMVAKATRSRRAQNEFLRAIPWRPNPSGLETRFASYQNK